MHYVVGLLNGEFDDEVLKGLIEAMVQKRSKDSRGVGMQNFQYSPAWDEICHIINIISPCAYRALKAYFPMPDQRTFRMREARQPRFPLEICNRTFELVTDYLSSVNYSGPTSLSCDDTKLFSTLRLYWDSQKKAHYLLGGIDSPILVNDPENVKEAIAAAKDKKATKVSASALNIFDVTLLIYFLGATLVSDSCCAQGPSHNCLRLTHS